MKPLLFSLCLFTSSILVAQVPQAIKYQAVARGAMGALLANANITLRVSIIDSAASGAVVYSEVHNASTNQFGVFNIDIGRGNQATGIFANINWAIGSKWLQLEMSTNGGITFYLFGSSELLSVPYALYAGSTNVTDRDSQQLSLIGNSLSISNGNTVNLPNAGNDNQTLSLSGVTLSISNGNSIDLTSFLYDTDEQTLSYSSGVLSISGGNSVVIPDNVDDADADTTNELQLLSISNDTVFLTNGGFVKLPPRNDTTSTVPKVHIYTTDTTWTKPARLKYVVVEVVGGGGGGGGGGGSSSFGAWSGGGGGGYAKKIIDASILGSAEAITVGLGGIRGVPNVDGRSGDTTSFGSHCSATGGAGGLVAGTPRSAGGTGIGGNVNIDGEKGGLGICCNDYLGGSGGSSILGTGGQGGVHRGGMDGYSYGGGGGGASSSNGTGYNGGSGASGVVIVTEYY